MEKVHKHGLARSDRAVEIETTRYGVDAYYWVGYGGCSREEFTELEISLHLCEVKANNTNKGRSDFCLLRW